MNIAPIRVFQSARERRLLQRIAAYERAAIRRIEFGGTVVLRQCKLCDRVSADEQFTHDTQCPAQAGPGYHQDTLYEQPRMVTLTIEHPDNGPSCRLVRSETGEIVQAGIPDHELAHFLGQAWVDGWMTGFKEATDKMSESEAR